MPGRHPLLQEFLTRTAEAIRAAPTKPPGAGEAARRIFAALEAGRGQAARPMALRLPVCDWLDPALAVAGAGPAPLAALGAALSGLEPLLSWRRRNGAERECAGFFNGHANACVVGPGGLEERHDVTVGVSLVAPRVRYPDHAHPPEEVYVSLAGGEWRNDDTDWHAPGPGGLIYNKPGIGHAMRTAAAPLLAVWCLWAG